MPTCIVNPLKAQYRGMPVLKTHVNPVDRLGLGISILESCRVGQPDQMQYAPVSYQRVPELPSAGTAGKLEWCRTLSKHLHVKYSGFRNYVVTALR